jgi:hypothetical protein
LRATGLISIKIELILIVFFWNRLFLELILENLMQNLYYDGPASLKTSVKAEKENKREYQEIMKR